MRALQGFIACLTVLAMAGPAVAQSGTFGNAVVIGTGELIIAEPNNNFRPGLVYIYRESGNTWREVAKLQAPDAQRADGFGAALALNGSTLFVAQRDGRIHTFEKQGTTWRPTGTLNATGIIGAPPTCSQYGYCGTDFGLSLASQGEWLLVGDAGTRQPTSRGANAAAAAAEPARPGAVHVFRRGSNGVWTQHSKFEAAGATAYDGFGSTIALANGRALIGAPNWQVTGETPLAAVGRVVEFRLENDSWKQADPLGSAREAGANFGASIALQGDSALIGAPGSGNNHGAAYVFRRDPASGTWTEQSRLAAFNSTAGDRFGAAVALAGEDVWVGAPAPREDDTGMAYIYRGGADSPLLESTRRIRLTRTVTRDAFGDRVAVRGGLAAVSATGMHHTSGTVHVYRRDATGEWQPRATLASPPDALPAVTGKEIKCTNGKAGPFDCSQVELLAFIPNSMLRPAGDSRGVRTNDNWGWTDPVTGREYALVGRNDGTSFVDITDPTNPVLVGDLPKTPGGPPSPLWRDMKTYKDHVFIVADAAGAHGMQVFDLRRLRNVRNKPAVFKPDALYTRINSSHNIVINEETGFAYTVGNSSGGETCGGGLHMIDIREPLNPKFMGCYRDQRGTHDAQCLIYRGPDAKYRGREICLKSNADVLAISDVTDKANPKFVGRAPSPGSAYLHQGWVTEDHKYFFMDDESDVIRGNVPTTRTLIWDLSNLEDLVLAKAFMGSLPASAHNQYVKGNYAYQANYRYGLHVLDITDPVNPKEAGTFDTAPFQSGPGFSGAWSTYPFFKSGTVIVTSLQEGLFILKPRGNVVF